MFIKDELTDHFNKLKDHLKTLKGHIIKGVYSKRLMDLLKNRHVD